ASGSGGRRSARDEDDDELARFRDEENQREKKEYRGMASTGSKEDWKTDANGNPIAKSAGSKDDSKAKPEEVDSASDKKTKKELKVKKEDKHGKKEAKKAKKSAKKAKKAEKKEAKKVKKEKKKKKKKKNNADSDGDSSSSS
ncbi:unnamed protein product, partial [Polarella glacialis]